MGNSNEQSKSHTSPQIVDIKINDYFFLNAISKGRKNVIRVEKTRNFSQPDNIINENNNFIKTKSL